MKEREIISEALHQFSVQTGLTLKEISLGKLSKKGKQLPDTRVCLKQGKEEVEFTIEAKNELRQEHLPAILDLVGQRKKENWLVVSQYIPKPLKDLLRKQAICYLEASGNCFIKAKGFFIYINDQPVTQVRMPEQGKLWKTTGLKFLFVLLQYPHIINEPYRTIANTSKVALGNIGPFIEELRKEGYIKKDKEGAFFFENQEPLQRKWAELFPSVLKPKLSLGKYRFVDKDRIHNWGHIPTKHFYWGGEPAGAILTNYLKPEKLTIYTSYPKVKLMQELKLVPDENGNVEMIEVFWHEQEVETNKEERRTVPPFLAYAELATSLDSRNRETAEKIKGYIIEHAR